MQKFLVTMACLGVLLLAACDPKPGQPVPPKTAATAPASR
jgi:hypothetical protein